MDYTYVKRPNYVTFGSKGEVEELFCKVCGSAIGGLSRRIVDRRMTADKQWIETVELRFRRFANYVELKMQFADGSYHVTNGCSGCLTPRLDVLQLHELHIADMLLDNMMYPGQEEHMNRMPLEVVAIRTDGGGLL